MSFTQVDNVNLVIFGRPDFESVWWPGSNYTAADGPEGDFEPTKGSVINHIAFSYRDIEPVYERMKANGADVQGPIATDSVAGHKSFYVLAPDNLLIEVVEARSIPDASWETD
jgi:catechol 2,3-dioxygenase-like lactoylglutathione lyase family enzyme